MAESVAPVTLPGSSWAPQLPQEEIPTGALRTFARAWRIYSRRAARYQAELLLSLIYFLVLGPAAIAMRAAGRHLMDRGGPGWSARDPGPRTLEAHKRQF